MPAQKELTAVERDKLEIDPNFDFRALAKVPFKDIPNNVKAMFKWCGVYTQLQEGFFMIRVVTPGGIMTTAQFGRAVELAARYGQGEVCITTRQTLQFHWIRLQDVYKVIEGMAEVGITTKNGCGDVIRNTVTCSLQGVCPHEVGEDVRRLTVAVATDPEIQDRQRNLPRKHKISVAGCDRACAQTLMNCQGWVPRQREDGTTGWRFHAGGGLGARPYMGKVIFDWVPNELALPVVRATVEAFRRHGDRRNRALARLKVVVDRMGPEAFGKLLLEILQERKVEGLEQIIPATDSTPRIQPAFLAGQESVPQRQEGLTTVRVRIPRSEIRTDDGRKLVELSGSLAGGEVMFTNRQSLELRQVPTERVPLLLESLHTAGFATAGHEHIPDVVACVGTTQCKMAVSDTPAASREIVAQLGVDEAYWKAIGPLRINMNGCPNNCAHAWIADIGLRGKRRRGEAGQNIEGYSLFIGGKLSEDGRVGWHLVDVDTPAVAPTIKQILDTYLEARTSYEETFLRYVERVGIEQIQGQLLAE
jgi:sulfite reductase beta subunit-like hemoprotein